MAVAITVPIYYRPHPKLMATESSSIWRFAWAPGIAIEFTLLGAFSHTVFKVLCLVYRSTI